MDEARPISLLVAVVAVGLLGLGGVVAAPLVLAQAAGAEELDDHLGAIGGAFLAVTGVGLAAVGLVGLIGSAGLWRRRAWGWVAGVLTTGLVVLGALLAITLSESGMELVIGMTLGVSGAIAAWWPATRRACRV